MFKKWFLLTKPTSGSMLENSSTWYHISTRGINHTRRWFHKWSSTLSDYQVKQVPSHTRAQVYQIDDPCYDIEGGVPSIGIKIKDPMCGISISHTSGIYKWCHFNNQVMSIKNARFKPQPSTPNANLCINEKHTFLWKLMTKGERLYKDMKALGDIETKK